MIVYGTYLFIFATINRNLLDIFATQDVVYSLARENYDIFIHLKTDRQMSYKYFTVLQFVMTILFFAEANSLK
jgi:hypothetical protein